MAIFSITFSCTQQAPKKTPSLRTESIKHQQDPSTPAPVNIANIKFARICTKHRKNTPACKTQQIESKHYLLLYVNTSSK
uniref:Uncharacterized protein n=1 Tax=Arundo donax TaxID=35708 RepID=A0A0A9D8V1_ARUDO